jgi:uncharacterized protein (DUF2141 family)
MMLVALALGAAVGGPAHGDERLIEAEIVGLRSAHGAVLCALFRSADGFPSDATRASGKAMGRIEGGRAFCRFPDVTAGPYAIAFFHDENGNGRFDTNFLGIPKEGYGASNDAHSTFRAPKFKDARFEYRGGALKMRLRTNY